jgi:aspartyl-tRNA(Asn)/glutamyl-tRNA(Gln) amidotransferase subunit A
VPVPDYRAALSAGLQGVRIGVPRAYFWDHLDAEVAAAVEAALPMLARLGARVHDVALSDVAEAVAARGVIHSAEAFAYHAVWLRDRPHDYGADLRQRLRHGANTTGLALVDAERCLARFVAAAQALLTTVDVLVTPTVPAPAWRFDAPDVTLAGGTESARALGLRLTTPFTALGGPSLSVPCGFTTAGLPIGLQIAGRRFDETTVLRVGHAYEQATNWHARRPPLSD